jgi:PAS domain S-box-containing protein
MMIKLGLVTETPDETRISATGTDQLEPAPVEDEAPAESLFAAMKGALRRTDRVDLSGFGFFIVKPRKRSHEALALLSAILESSSDAIVGTTLDGRIMTWNRGAELVFGYEPAEASGASIASLGGAGSREIPATLAKLKHGATCVEFETELRTRDGRAIVAQVTASAITDRKGKPTAALFVARDVTERRKAEEELRKGEHQLHALMDSCPDLVLVLERDGTIRFVNSAVRRLLDYQPTDLIGKNPLDWVHPQDVGVLKLAARRLVLEDRGGPLRFRLRHRDGSWRNVEGLARQASTTIDDAAVMVGVRDITERMRFDDQLRRDYGQSERMQAAEALAGAVAEDLNGLLTTISGYTELIMVQLGWGQVAGSDRLIKDAEQIKTASDRASLVTQRLLAFGQKQLMQPRVIDLNSLVSGLETEIRRMVSPGITIAAALDPKCGRVRIDREQIERVIRILVKNAGKAMPRGGALTIETRNVELEGDSTMSVRRINPGSYAMISITDTGRGMEEDALSRLFEPSYKANETHAAGPLELPTAYGIVKQSEGHLSVTSQPGVGTTFKICLPRVDVADDPLTARGDSLSIPRGTETVLLLEHDEAARALARQILVMAGYAVLEARNGQEARQLCEAYPAPIHLLIADAGVSDMSPDDIANSLLPLRLEMRVLHTRSYNDHGESQQSMVDSSWPHILKPYSPIALARKTREVLDGSQRVKAHSA